MKATLKLGLRMALAAVAAAAAPLAAVAAAPPASADASVWGLDAAMLVAAPVAGGDARSSRFVLQPSMKVAWNGTEARARLRLRHASASGDDATRLDIRELTAGWRHGDVTTTLGVQQLNWGRMDIVRVTDVVNPVDQADLFHEELPEAKLALAMANVEWQRGAQALQLVVAPQVAVDRLPARWRGVPMRMVKPAASLANASLALRYGVEAGGWNADLVAVRGWQAAPVPRLVIDSAGPVLVAGPVRQTSLGFSADRPFGAMVLRLEGLAGRVGSPAGAAAANAGPAMADTPPGARNIVSFGVGLDVRAGAWFFAGQAIARHGQGGASGTADDGFVSLIAQRKWLQDRLSGRAMHIRETRSASTWTSLQLAYELSANQVLQLQADRFAGAHDSAFGSLAERSRVAASLRVRY